jgi:hypothetical protein
MSSVSVRRMKNDTRVDVGIQAQHRAQEALVPRRPAAHVQHAHAVADDLEGEGLAVVAVDGLAGQHGRLDFEHVVTRLVGREIEDHAHLRRFRAQHHRLGIDQAPVAQQRHLDHAATEAAMMKHGLQLDRRAHEGEVIGQHRGHGQIA